MHTETIPTGDAVDYVAIFQRLNEVVCDEIKRQLDARDITRDRVNLLAEVVQSPTESDLTRLRFTLRVNPSSLRVTLEDGPGSPGDA